MKILVPLKRVPDYEAKIKINSEQNGVVTDGIKWILNPFDEIAVEEAIRLKEAGKADEVVVVTIGPEDCVTQLRYAMAMGADRAILVKYSSEVDSDLASKLLTEIYKQGEYGLIVMGKQAIDSDASQTPQLLAARLDLPQACFASKVEILDDKQVKVTREVDGGLETLQLSLPCIISTDLRLNEPRYAPLPGIMKAKKKPLDEIDAESLKVDLAPKVKVLRMSPPPARSGGRKVENVQELIKALKDEAKVL